MYAFGAGRLLAAQTRNSAGSAITLPSFVEFGTLQDLQVDIQFESKVLHGSRMFPAAVGRGKGKVEVKSKTADINGRIFGELVFGGGSTVGVRQMASSASTPIPSTPFKITPTVPNSGTWAEDVGVVDASTGVAFKKVSGPPNTGEYSVSTGEYTFASADTTDNVVISFIYTTSAGAGFRGSITSDLMGYTPTFRALLQNTYNGKTVALDLLMCVSDQFSLPFKNDDFSINDFSFQAMANDANLLGYWSVSE